MPLLQRRRHDLAGAEPGQDLDREPGVPQRPGVQLGHDLGSPGSRRTRSEPAGVPRLRRRRSGRRRRRTEGEQDARSTSPLAGGVLRAGKCIGTGPGFGRVSADGSAGRYEPIACRDASPYLEAAPMSLPLRPREPAGRCRCAPAAARPAPAAALR